MGLARTGATVMVVLSLAGCAATGEKASTGFVDENFIHELPTGWELGFQDRQGQLIAKEYVPKGQTVENWEEMLTTQIFLGGVAQSPDEFAATMREAWQKACPESRVYPGRSGTERGYRFVFWQQVCANNPQTNRPEITFLKAIEGNDSFYLIQKAWKWVPEEEEAKKWAVFMRRVYVCDSRLADRPCPKVNGD